MKKDPPLSHNSFTYVNPSFERMIEKNGFIKDIYKFLGKSGE
jgi:hypothetical protein